MTIVLENVLADLWANHTLRSLLISSMLSVVLWLTLRPATLRRMLSPSLRFWLWWLVCLRFALAFAPSPTIAFSVPSIASHWLIASAPGSVKTLPHYEASPGLVAILPTPRTADVPNPKATGPASAVTGPPNSASDRDFQAQRLPMRTPIPLASLALAVWTLGSLVRLLLIAVSTSQVRRLIRTARPVQNAQACRIFSEVWGGPSPPDLIEHPDAPSPFLAGLFRPVIVLPRRLLGENPDVLRRVLAHEVRHLRRSDLWTGLLPMFCRCAFWWLPSAALAARECLSCAEEDCDLAAISGADREQTRRYAEILIRLALVSSNAPASLAATGLSATSKTLRRRLLALKAPSAATAPGGRVVALMMAGVLALAVPTFRLSATATNSVSDFGAGGPRYELVDLGSPGSGSSAAESIGASGDVVGYQTAAGKSGLQSVVWRDGQAQPIRTNLGFPSTRAVAVNTDGDIALTAFGLTKYQHAAVVTRAGGAYTLQSLRRFPYSTAVALDDQQMAAGYVYSGQKFGQLQSRAVLWNHGLATDLGTLGGQCSAAFGLDGRGDVVGKAETTQGATHAFVANAAGGGLTDLGALTSTSDSAAYAINQDGDIVGFSDTDDPTTQHAVIWPKGAPQPADLGSLYTGGISKARAINDLGEIVGVSTKPGDSGARATLWKGGRIYDLNAQLSDSAPGWVLRYAVGINDAGQVVGVGQKNGETRAFLLRPV